MILFFQNGVKVNDIYCNRKGSSIEIAVVKSHDSHSLNNHPAGAQDAVGVQQAARRGRQDERGQGRLGLIS